MWGMIRGMMMGLMMLVVELELEEGWAGGLVLVLGVLVGRGRGREEGLRRIWRDVMVAGSGVVWFCIYTLNLTFMIA